ncbi:MAG: hypothetical protein HN366_07265 [Deltaproteobacteria bacterium]|nr:hypothetical protein [Deltaproteobacteria bacterium]
MSLLLGPTHDADIRQTDRRQPNKAPYWVVTNNDTPKKRCMLEDVLQILGYSKAAIEEAVSALN